MSPAKSEQSNAQPIVSPKHVHKLDLGSIRINVAVDNDDGVDELGNLDGDALLLDCINPKSKPQQMSPAQ